MNKIMKGMKTFEQSEQSEIVIKEPWLHITSNHLYNKNTGEVFTLKRQKILTILDGNRYIMLHIGIKKYFAHRIIWEYFNQKKIPDRYEIDHINHNRNDNRIENLRILNRAQNCANTSSKKTSRSGVLGMFEFLTTKNKKRYRVDRTINGKRFYKRFETRYAAENYSHYLSMQINYINSESAQT